MKSENFNISDQEKEKLIAEFSDKFCILLEEYIEKIPETALAAFLMEHAKQTMCSWGMNYYNTLGILTSMLHEDLEETFDSWSESKRDLEYKEKDE